MNLLKFAASLQAQYVCMYECEYLSNTNIIYIRLHNIKLREITVL